MKTIRIFTVSLFAFLFLIHAAYPQQGFDEDLLKPFRFRNLGPYRAGSWVGDLAVPESKDPKYRYTFYVVPRNGGVWKTVNNGTTFTPIFDDQGTNSIGAIALAPSDPETVWVGTGEDFNCRLSYPGNGIYKSLDGGATWKMMGLEDSHHIAVIKIHPTDPGTVYAAVMGHLFSANEQRGIFKTEDGGATWKKVLYINDRIGVIDLVMDPRDPETLYASAYDKQRLPWHLERGGPESGIYKTVDGGLNWKRLSGGLPGGNIGRIGLDIYRRDPKILYAVIENLNLRPSTDKEIAGEVYRTDDGGSTWKKMNNEDDDVSGKAAYSFNKIYIDPNNEKNLYIASITLTHSHDGGRTWLDLKWPARHRFTRMFGDVRTFWIDPDDSNHMMIGSDGGLFISYDGGKSVDHLYNIPLGEIYCVGVDMEDPYNIYLGLQDHDGWKAPVNTWSGQITLDDWRLVGLWDGMAHRVDPQTSRWLYITTQFGGHHRIDQKLGERVSILPKREENKPPYRFPWTPDLIISPHDSKVLYAGAQMLLRSTDRGDRWEELSPDLTMNDPIKIAGKGHMMYCTITSISESPLKPGLIWVGTDDGKLHLTRNHGKNWTELTDKITEKGAPADYWVTRVLASNFDEGSAYVVKSGFKFDDFRPFVYRTDNFGKTWTDLSSNLPPGPLNVIAQDVRNQDLLFVGNNTGLDVSINRGKSWVPFKNNMPPVPVQDILVHSRENDLVVGTYGRGAFVTDISPLQELSEKLLNKEVHLFEIEPKPSKNYSQANSWGSYRLDGHRHLFTPNERNGLVIYYYLKQDAAEKVDITVLDSEGREVKALQGAGKKGINRVVWDTRDCTPGTYKALLKAKGHEISGEAEVKERIIFPVGRITGDF